LCGKISREWGQEGRVDLFSTLWRAWACLIRMRVGDIELGYAKVRVRSKSAVCGVHVTGGMIHCHFTTTTKLEKAENALFAPYIFKQRSQLGVSMLNSQF